jgi:hypothetical protein
MLTDIETLANDPDAAQVLGPQNMIPGMDAVAKYFRSGEQNDLTGLISGLQSMTYKDISGANVTASEEPRLKRYVPSVDDDQATVRRKVARFKQEYETIEREIASLAEQQGYKPANIPSKPPASKPSGGKMRFNPATGRVE